MVCLLQWEAAHGDAGDPPEVAGRLSYLDGQTIVQTHQRAFEPALLNWPIVAGDRLITQRGAHAELALGIVTVRLDEMTDVAVTHLSPEGAQIEIRSGSINLHVPAPQPEDSVLVRGGAVKMQLAQPGDYRVAILNHGGVTTTVRAGEASVDTGAVIFQQLEGESATVEPDRTLTIADRQRLDDFDQWSVRRQGESTGQVTAGHVARGVVGYEDLDRYGTWRWEPGYGMAWEPRRVAADWAPYRFGKWIWKEPWGWSWVDDTPWGFAPFHYGRWVYRSSRWLWLPGPRHVAPVYAPALVGWIDDVRDRDSIGWFPLGPQEFFSPSYPVSEPHARRLNSFVTTVVRGTALANGSTSSSHGRDATIWGPRSLFAQHPPARQQPRQSTLGREIVR